MLCHSSKYIYYCHACMSLLYLLFRPRPAMNAVCSPSPNPPFLLQPPPPPPLPSFSNPPYIFLIQPPPFSVLTTSTRNSMRNSRTSPTYNYFPTWRMATIWGGTSLHVVLQMLLRSLGICTGRLAVGLLHQSQRIRLPIKVRI